MKSSELSNFINEIIKKISKEKENLTYEAVANMKYSELEKRLQKVS
ncbi:hypothetical protein [Fusobacterium sp.]|nr:hypothetical protein [Fusobacterium sp.]MDU1912646.1 hypothetical protein [Fusobacterium sp.]